MTNKIMDEKIKATGIIPVRYASQRFPGKPLALIAGKPMIQHVYERAGQASLLEALIIATDDARIYKAAKDFGADVRLTSAGHRSGTERAAEAALELNSPIIVNIQGDEPLIHGDMIDSLVSALEDSPSPMATLAAKEYDLSLFDAPSPVKVVLDAEGKALYFSRSPIPQGTTDYFWKHIGIYAYRRTFLLRFSSLRPSRLEKLEKLEQLRALENGYPIKVIETTHVLYGVDYPEDINTVESLLKKENHA
jgi:3-deoxy-manno-octulosonate cytidylyltransferase (CMP-KDO synthetase)